MHHWCTLRHASKRYTPPCRLGVSLETSGSNRREGTRDQRDSLVTVANRLSLGTPPPPHAAGGSRRQRRLRGRDWLPPNAWAECAEGRPPVAVCNHLSGALIQRWSSTAPAMMQPPLDHHLLVLHLGGPKRIVRSGGLSTAHVDIGSGAFTMVPAGSSYRWLTAGPIDFAHLFLHPDRFARDIAETYGVAADQVRFADQLGRSDAIVRALFELLLADSGTDPLAAEARLTRLNLRLATLTGATLRALGDAPLPPARVARVRDYVRAHLATPITLDALASEGGMSRYHFIRAFRAATGLTPYAFVIAERVAAAVDALRAGERTIAEIAVETGFSSPARFSERFRALIGHTPAEFRRACR